MTFVTLALVAGWVLNVSALMQFINPAPFGRPRDFSNSETFNVGSTVNVAWTPAESGKAASLVLWQLDNTTAQWFGDMEYLTQGAVGVTRYTWLVGTRKNLSTSNLFYLSIFQEGKSDSDSNSHYFYIAEKAAQQSSAVASSTNLASSTPSSSSSSASVASATVSAGSSSIPVQPSTSSTSGLSNTSTGIPPAAQQQSTSNGFPLAAKIGIGAGIPAALAIGLGIGFLLFRRRKKKDETFQVNNLGSGSPYSPSPKQNIYANNGHYYGSNLNEAPPKSPVEIAPRQGESYYMPQHNHAPQVNQVPRQSPEVVTVRYEM
ncbi:hypothetical protein BKA63DRAFT_512940 [Paraphoma chrysanthemicola]|nr:hypothetical protein BKA63DRAFT_512940 [Paraphoma chrysanthemicola]